MISMWVSSTIGPIIKRMSVPSRRLVNASCRALSSENIDGIPRGQSSTSSSNDAPHRGGGFYNQTGRVMEWKDGDWLCDNCGNHVYAFRQACPRCNTAKQHRQDVGWADAYTDTPKQRTASPRHKPGDWDCSACGFHNYASRHVCFRCKESRPDGVGVVVSGMRGTANAFPELYKPGDWECPSCKAHNYSSRLACFRCRLPKTHEARVFGGDPNRSVTSLRISGDGSCISKGLPEVESEEESSNFAEYSAKTKQNQNDR